VRKEYQRAKILTSHFYSQHLHLSQNGYDYVFGEVYNPITLKQLLLCGGQVVKKIVEIHGGKEY